MVLIKAAYAISASTSRRRDNEALNSGTRRRRNAPVSAADALPQASPRAGNMRNCTPIDQKRCDRYSGPDPIAEEQHCAQRDAGCRPHRRNVAVGKRSGEAYPAGNEICSKNKQHPKPVVSKRPRLRAGLAFSRGH